jgi:hypothetical protein
MPCSSGVETGQDCAGQIDAATDRSVLRAQQFQRKKAPQRRDILREATASSDFWHA